MTANLTNTAPTSPASGALPADSHFLTWLADRLVHVYGENPNVDFVHATRRIAAALASREASSATISSEQARMLVDALGRCIAASGIVRDDIDGFSGPQLLMFADDLCEMLKQRAGHEASPALLPREQDFHDWFAANYNGEVVFSDPRWHSESILRWARRALASPQVAPALTDEQMREALWFAMDMTNVIGRTRANLIEYFLHKVNKDRLATPVQVAPQGKRKPWDTLTALEKAPKLIEELESESERITRCSNSPLDGLLQSAADVLRELTATGPAPVAPPNLSSPLAGDCRTVGGFLSDVMTAAGLVEHGRQCKPLAERISVACSDLRARIFQGSAPVAPTDEREVLRAEQAAAVMPQIGPLLDAFEGLNNDTLCLLRDEAPGLLNALRAINRSMEDCAPVAPTPAPGAVLDVIDAFERQERGTVQAHVAAKLVAELRRALLVAPTPAQPSEWQPIETAPQRGIILLGLTPNEEHEDGYVSPGYWMESDDDGPDNMGHDAGFVDVHFDFFTCARSIGNPAYQHKGLQPTHWQPLPPPPLPSEPEGESGHD